MQARILPHQEEIQVEEVEVTGVLKVKQYFDSYRGYKSASHKEERAHPVLLQCRKGFLNRTAIDIWDQITLHCGESPGHYGMFSSLPGLHLLDARSTSPQSPQPRMCPDITTHPWDWGAKLPQLRTLVQNIYTHTNAYMHTYIHTQFLSCAAV